MVGKHIQQSYIGLLTDLQTTDKSNIVAAINEMKASSGKTKVNSYTWSATANQTVFTLTTGSYVPNKGNMEVHIGGKVLISGTDYTETSPTSFTLLTITDLEAGDTVYAKWFENVNLVAGATVVEDVLTSSSNSNALSANQGKVLNNKIGVLSNLTTTAKTDLVSAVNEINTKAGNTKISEQSWTAGVGQTVFNLTTGSYITGKGTLQVFIGGIALVSGVDYIESSPTSFTLTNTDLNGEIVYAKWFEQVNLVANLNPTKVNAQSWTATANQTVFTLTSGTYLPGKANIEVHVGGNLLISGIDYTETSGNSFTLLNMPDLNGELVCAKWFENVNLVAGAVTVEDSLTSTNNTNALSANQGRLLDGKIATNSASLSDITQKLSDLATNVENFPIQVPESDDSGRIQRAINSLNGKPGIVLLPRSSYTVNSPVNINTSNITLQGNGYSTVITSNQDNNIFYVTGAYVTIKDLKLVVTSTNRTKYTVQCFNTNKTMFKNVYFDNTGSSLSGIWFNGGSMGLVENCMLNHSRINVGTWDVKIEKCYIWALSQDYGIGITNGAGNTTLTNVDVVPPLKSVATRKAAIWIDSSVSACFNTKMTNIYFDGNPTLDTGVGLLISPNTGLVTLSDFSANKMDDDVIVIDSAFSITIERGLFSNNNNKGTGAREVFIKKSGTQPLENINIRNNQFVQTTTITGTTAPVVEVDVTVGSQYGIKIQFNDIKQPSGGGAYVDPEIKCDYTTINSIFGNTGTLSRYSGRGSMAVASGASGATISSLGGAYPLAYEPSIGKYILQAEGFTMPSYRIQKISRNSIFISFATTTAAAGTLYWNVDL